MSSMKRRLPLVEEKSSRRSFLELMTATLAIAGVDGCARPRGDALPFTHEPEAASPGNFIEYSTALPQAAFGVGVIGRTREGRPVKLEGNPDHPASLGGTNAILQAALWELYDPNRARVVKRRNEPSAFRTFLDWMHVQAEGLRKSEGEGLHLLVEPTASPSLSDMRSRLLARYPKARIHGWSPASHSNAYDGAALAFGQPYEAVYDLSSADVIVSLDADFLATEPSSIVHMHRFADRRVPQAKMNRLYIVECALSTTGMNADHRLRARSSEVASVALSIVKALLESGGLDSNIQPSASLRTAIQEVDSPYADWTEAVAKDLARAQGSSVVVAGMRQPPIVHAVAYWLNDLLGNTGKTIRHLPPQLDPTRSDSASLRGLIDEIEAGKVRYLFIDSFDPVYAAPVDLELAGHLGKVPHAIYTALFEDETSRLCEWFIPKAHTLESWGDLRAQDGTVAIVQPLIEPLFDGYSAPEVLAAMLDEGGKSSRELIASYWQQHLGGGFETAWAKALVRGTVEGTAAAMADAQIDQNRLESAIRDAVGQSSTQGMEIDFVVDPRLGDGRHAHNSLLQELAHPVTKITWGNAAQVSHETAKRLDVRTGDVVTLEYQGRYLDAPIFVMRGHADEAVTLSLGHGRKPFGHGFDAYRLRTSSAPWYGGGISLRKTSRKHPFAIPQGHETMEGRPLALRQTIADYERGSPLAEGLRAPLASLYDSWHYPGHRWGMMVDLSRCTGCSACMVACQVENNSQVVGPKDIAKGRDMHWLRIDRYFDGSENNPQVVFQPVMCQHCEKAPCEYVCPVNATVHSDEGLNEMVYNRCVGTRYCSNNCPYKVRRFNWFDYQGSKTAVERMRANPEVTLRSRGVMEKCTYCVQRIEHARIDARVAGREIRDGDIQTACQQACPASAIVFGDLNDPDSRARALYQDARRYALLHELGTEPRTGYLVRIVNPNPELT